MSWRFAVSPKWIVRHVAVAVLVVTMVLLGFWQLRRLDDKRAHSSRVEARQELPAVAVTDLLDEEMEVGDETVEDVLYRRVRARGSYDERATVVVPNRTFNSAPGAWVLTPLDLDEGPTVIVNRGFIGFDRDGRLIAPPPPAGPVLVEGMLFPSQERGRFGGDGPADASVAELARADLEAYASRLGHPVLPAYIQLTRSDPNEPSPAAGAPELVALGPPELDEGPHLAYAVQWFLFTTIAVVGYGLLLRKVALAEGRSSRAVTDLPVEAA